MQSSDGGWGAFDADNTGELCPELPFCDFGEVIDPPSADVTAHVVEFLAAEPRVITTAARRSSGCSPAGARRVVVRTVGRQPRLRHGRRADGARRRRRPATTGRVRRAVSWLEEHQNGDGGWGEDLRSYRDRHWVGRGESTPSQTAWALLGLLAAKVNGATVGRGVRWLVEAQRPDGTGTSR